MRLNLSTSIGRILANRKAEYDPARTVTTRIVNTRIRDTGPEKNSEGVQRLFNEHVSTKPDHHNNGYGCYIAYELAKERCGWKLDATNKPDGGAQFTITIRH